MLDGTTSHVKLYVIVIRMVYCIRKGQGSFIIIIAEHLTIPAIPFYGSISI